MVKESLKFQKYLHVFVFIICVAAILVGIFSFNMIRDKVGMISSSDDVAGLKQGISYIYMVAGLEILILSGVIVSSLFVVSYIFRKAYMATEMSLIDELTGVYNRRALYNILDNEIKRAERFKHPLTVIMIDLDFFKVFNDKNGHVAGDLLLQKLCKIFSSKIRDVDTVARYGGEEFILVLPETSHHSAAKIAERIRKAVETTYFKGQETQPRGKITISMGLVTYQGEYKNRTHLIHSADELLYRAKELGRNQLIKEHYKDMPTEEFDEKESGESFLSKLLDRK